MYDRGLFFRMSKELLLSSEWAALPPISKAVYPAVAVHADRNGKAFPSVEKIAELTGVDDKAAGTALKAIFDGGLPQHRRTTYFTKKGHKAYRYYMPTHTKTKGAIRLYKNVVYSEAWEKMSISAKAVYIAIQAVSFFHFDQYADEQEIYAPQKEDDLFEQRLYDHVSPGMDWLVYNAKRGERTVKKALIELQNTGLIDTTTKPWKVFLPKVSF